MVSVFCVAQRSLTTEEVAGLENAGERAHGCVPIRYPPLWLALHERRARAHEDSVRGVVSLKYLIGAREYKTKKAAQEAIREVLYRYSPGETVSRPEDQEFLADLILNHPDPASKIGVGIARFEVRDNWGTHGFWVIRTDGSETDFSFVKCLHPPTKQQTVHVALRRAVMDQMMQFREAALRNGPAVCPVTGQPIDDSSAHVDHYDPTFFELADSYVAARGGYNAFRVLETADGVFGRRLADPVAAAAWQEYHRANAKLRLVSKKANLSLLRRQSTEVL